MSNPNKLELTPINHVVFVLDESGSMGHHRDTVPDVIDQQVAMLAKESVRLNQETRVSIYRFNGSSGCKCVVYDRDVLRAPSLKGHYRPDGGTPLVSSTHLVLNELGQTPELHADHAFLVYVITDGEDTGHNSHEQLLLRDRLKALKDNWTVAALVPSEVSARVCKTFGFLEGNIQIWDCSSKAGLERAAQSVTAATQNYMTLRSQGARSTKNLFTPSQTAKRTDIVKVLAMVTDPYVVYQADANTPKEPIQQFVERATGKPYMVGSAYYALVKPETIQKEKKICLRTKGDGRLYSGTHDSVCKVLGLPTGGEIKVGPAELNDFEIFVQSTSVNRNVIAGQKVVVVKL